MSIAEICRAADDARALRLALLAELRQQVGFDAYAWLLTDPVTEVGTAPIADALGALDELPRLIRLKYATLVNRWTHLNVPVALLHASTEGRLDRSLVWRECLHAHGVRDVASVVFRDRYGCWSFLDLWRIDSIFSDTEAQLLARHVDAITRAIRGCALRSFATPHDASGSATATGPIVLVLSAGLEVRAQTPATEVYLRALVPPDGDRSPVPAAAFNVAAQLLAAESGLDDHPPVARVSLAAGKWLTLRAARMGSDIAVAVEQTSPSDRCELIARAAGLTAREAELLDRLTAGADSRTLAQQMSLSTHTLQDHLQAVFAKTGARNRREVLAWASGR